MRTRPGVAIQNGLTSAGQSLSGIGLGSGKFVRAVTSPIRKMGTGLNNAGTRTTNFANKARGNKGLLGHVWGGIRKSVSGVKQWKCNICGTVVGKAAKNPPGKCPNNTCPTNTAGGPPLSWS